MKGVTSNYLHYGAGPVDSGTRSGTWMRAARQGVADAKADQQAGTGERPNPYARDRKRGPGWRAGYQTWVASNVDVTTKYRSQSRAKPEHMKVRRIDLVDYARKASADFLAYAQGKTGRGDPPLSNEDRDWAIRQHDRANRCALAEGG